MANLFRFIAMAVVLIVAMLACLAVAGVLTSSELWQNVTKVAELAGIVLVALVAVLFLARTK